MTDTATATMTENMNGEHTAQFDTVEQLSHKMGISLEEAKNALEAAEWNTLTATYLLEQAEFRRKQTLNEVVESCTENDAAVKRAAFNKATQSGIPAAKGRAGKHEKGFSNLFDHFRRLVAYGNRNRFTVFKDSDRLLEMPVTALALLLLFSFGTCALLMVVGLFAGCRYSVTTAVEA